MNTGERPILPSYETQTTDIVNLLEANVRLGDYSEHAAYLYKRAVDTFADDVILRDQLHANLLLGAFCNGDSILATACLEAIEEPVTKWEAYAEARRYGSDILSASVDIQLGEALPVVELKDHDEDELHIRFAQLEINLLNGSLPRESDIAAIKDIWLFLKKDERDLNLDLSRLFAESGHMKQARKYFSQVERRNNNDYGYAAQKELLRLHAARTSRRLLFTRTANAMSRAQDLDTINERVIAWGGKTYSDEIIGKLKRLRPADFFARYNPEVFVQVEHDFERQGSWGGDLTTLATLLRGGALERARQYYQGIITVSAFQLGSEEGVRRHQTVEATAALLMATYDNQADATDGVMSTIEGGYVNTIDTSVERINEEQVHAAERRTELRTIASALTAGIETMPALPATERRLEVAVQLAKLAIESGGEATILKNGAYEQIGSAVKRAWELVAYTTDEANPRRLGFLAAIQALKIVVPSDPREAKARGHDIMYGELSWRLKQERGGDRLDRAITRMLKNDDDGAV